MYLTDYKFYLSSGKSVNPNHFSNNNCSTQKELVANVTKREKSTRHVSRTIEQPLDGVFIRRDMAKFHPDNWKYQRFQLPTPENSLSYFRQLPSGSKECFVDGTNWNQATNKSTICVCHDNYFGPDCGIPEAVWYGHFKNNPGDVAKLKRRPRMRRLIQAVLLNHEFDLFETRVHSWNDVTDVFLVQESKFTTHGDTKELKVLKKFHNGWLKDFHGKFLYVYLASFTEKQKISGWSADSYIREHIGNHFWTLQRTKMFK